MENFDHTEYIKNYKDLSDAGIETKEQAWEHWINFGINEGRIYDKKNTEYDLFDHITYINNYNDLSDAGILTKEDAWKHWINFGINEGRNYHKKNINKEQTKNLLYTKIVGGLGNQLFMIFNLISLSKEYNKTPLFYYDEDYIINYLKDKNTLRKNTKKYKIFSKINFEKLNNEELNNFETYNELEYKYNKINLENEKNYNINGYFQSYKYFWNNRDEIKKYLYIDYNKIN